MNDKLYKSHSSVLPKESISFLTDNSDLLGVGYFADLTFGGGGHSFAILDAGPTNRVIAVDQDPDAFQNGMSLIKKDEVFDRVDLLNINFVDFHVNIVEKYNFILTEHGGFSGILMDLGVSSHHFDQGERGFSFREDASLDMRMNCADDSIKTAADMINFSSCEELEKIFREYGEERYSARIAEKIVDEREGSAINTTKELENIIFHCYPKKSRYGRINPSTRCFQALRIAVNNELGVLERALPDLFSLLKPGGRLVVISFHSLEDRIVKHLFKKIALDKTSGRILTKRPVVPGEDEIKSNPRARSAKMRVIARAINQGSE